MSIVAGRHIVVDGRVSTIDIDLVTAELQHVRDQAGVDASAHHFANP